MPQDHDPNPRQTNDFERDDAPPVDPAEGTPAETPSGPFAPPPMPDVLKGAGPEEPTRHVGPIPKGRGGSAIQSGRVFAIGMDFAYGVIGCAALGWGIDWWFKTSPRWLLIGAGIGIVVAMYRFIREGTKLSRSGSRPRP